MLIVLAALSTCLLIYCILKTTFCYLVWHIWHEIGTGLCLQPWGLHGTLFHRWYMITKYKVRQRADEQTSEAGGWAECRLVMTDASSCSGRLVSGPRHQQAIKCRRRHAAPLHCMPVARRRHAAWQPTHWRNHLQQLAEVVGTGCSTWCQQLAEAWQNVLIQLACRHRTGRRLAWRLGMPRRAAVSWAISAMKTCREKIITNRNFTI